MIQKVMNKFVVVLAVLGLGPGLGFSGNTELVIPRACMKAVALTEQSECHGPDEDHMRCSGLSLVVKPECEQVRVIQ